MTEYVKKQLDKCVFADLSNFDPATNTYHIPRYEKPRYELGKCYLIKLPKYLINNPNTILAINWNAGLSPQNEYYKAYISKVNGQYIYIDGLAFNYEKHEDLTTMWSGWLDLNELTQIAQL